MQNLRYRIGVGQRVGALGLLGVFGLLLVGGIYLAGQRAEAPLRERASQLADSAALFTDMAAGLADARQFEADFFLRPSEIRAAQHQQALQQTLDQVDAIVRHPHIYARTQSAAGVLQVAARDYAAAGARAVALRRVLGIDGESGLRGQLHASSTELEHALLPVGDEAMLGAFIALREPGLSDADFAKHMRILRQELAALFWLDVASKPKLERLVDQFERDILAFARTAAEFTGATRAAEQAYEDARTAAQAALWLVNGQAARERAALTDAQARTAWLTHAALLITTLSVGCLAWRLGRGISRPLSRVAALTRRLASGDVDWTIPYVTRRDEIGDVARALSIFRDTIDTNRVAVERIYRLAHHDALTGLPNRTLLQERMAEAIGRARRGDGTLAVLCLDLDGFKAVNDLHGHSAGDRLLQEVAARLQANLRETDTAARLGGDEFVIVQEGPAQPAASRALADRLMESLSAPYVVGADGTEAAITTSIGVALCPADGHDPETLLRNADTALYRAKWAGKNRMALFQPEMDLELRERRALEQDLQHAIALRQFALAWQPLARTGGQNEVTGFEVLLRWNHPERGLVPPDLFIPVAEACGVICAIGAWVLQEACREATTWPEPLKVAVNVSPIQVQQGEAFALMVEDALDRSGLDPCRLVLEVTEGVLIREPEQVLAALCRLKARGVAVALDDFGTGYSSLATLRAFPFDKIKIDRSFTFGVTDNGQDAAIVRAVLGLARGLGVPVVAEGVETEAQLLALQRDGCEEVQGWLIGRPAPIDTFARTVGVTAALDAA